MKKKYLSYRIAFAAGIIGVITVINLLFMGMCLYKEELSIELLKPLLIADIGIYIAYTIGIYNYIVKPYLQMKKLYHQFSEGQIYEELFAYDKGWIPEWDEVMHTIRHLLDKQDAIKMSKKQAEYLALQNQINPHFLYNALDAIRGDAICAGLDSVVDATEALSSYFRYSITGVDKLVTLEEEIENVGDYFTIQYYRFGDKIKINIECPEEMNHLMVPKLTIQPFVENAIYHGLEQRISDGEIFIKMETTSKKLLIWIEDNGKGMAEEQVEKINEYLGKVSVSYVGESKKRKGGIAIKNVNSRIKLLFGEEYGVRIFSTRDVGTDVMITLPKIQREDYEEGTAAN